MPSAIIAAAIIGAAIVAAPHLAPASYQISSPGSAMVALRVNTRTGEVRLCVPDADGNMRMAGGASTSCAGGPR